MKTISDLMTEQAFFKGLSAEQLHSLAEQAKYRRYKANELIFHDGTLVNRFYVVVKGKVALEAPTVEGEPLRFQTVGAGELLSPSWMCSDYLRHVRARALEPTEVVYFCGEHLRRECDRNHQLGYQLFRRVAEVVMQRLQETRQLLLEQNPLSLTQSYDWQPGEH